MSTNIALNRPVEASSFVYPYIPKNTADGISKPINRWVGSSPIPSHGTPSPVWLMVDLGDYYWVNRWVVKQMGTVGWSADYNMINYKLQGSLNKNDWFDMDEVVNNSGNQTDRKINPYKVWWVRVYVTKGLRCNTNFASIVDLELYEADHTSAKLSGLTLSAGKLEPPFASTIYDYSARVMFDDSAITLTPIAEDSRATIKVEGSKVPSGTESEKIDLGAGLGNTIELEVDPYIGKLQYYFVTVSRPTSPYLSSISGGINLTLNHSSLHYTTSVPDYTESITIIPIAEDPGATIKVKGQFVDSGKKSQPISIIPGINNTSGGRRSHYR
jgi:hypothetical protein